MAKAKVAITLDEAALRRIDRLVRAGMYPNRSQAIQDAVNERLVKLNRSRLAREILKLDPAEEKAMAEEGLARDASEWPEY